MDEETRRFVRERARERCEYCCLPQRHHGLRFHVEHIRASQHRGGDEVANLALACPECNLRKGSNLTAVDPQTDQVLPLFNPRLDSWDEHFLWRERRIEGRTALGRATVRLLQLNSLDRQRVRELLERVGYRINENP